MSSRSRSRSAPSAGFTGDIRRLIHELGKRTSASHKRFVIFLILVGVALRASLLLRPITYDEAFAYVEFATQPLGKLLSDYRDPANQLLHTLLTKFSTGLFGVGRVQLRLPAFVAGVLVMPLFYIFVRAMFNRYIALMALALVAASGPLVEYSALARGFSMGWLCFVTALVLGRHMIKENNAVSAVAIGVVCALGMWAVPTMAYAALLIYWWMLFSLTAQYENTVQKRIMTWLLSLVVFVVVTGLVYMPVILEHGFDQLLHHRTVAEQGWYYFKLHHQDRAFDLWAYLIDSSSVWIAVPGIIGMLYAAFISSKFRFLAFAMLLGAMPLVFVQTIIGPPQVWLYALFIFHLSTAIAVFYLLKFLQEKLFTRLGKRTRTAASALVLLVLFASLGMPMAWERSSGMPEARTCVAYAVRELTTGDKLFVQHPWDWPVKFSAIELGLSFDMLTGTPAPNVKVLVACSPIDEQSVRSVLLHNAQDPAMEDRFKMVLEPGKLKIFAAP